MGENKGFSLVELLVLITILGILAALAVPFGADFTERHRVSSAARELYGNLQEVRLSAMTRTSDPLSRGFGVRFLSPSAYVRFEFRDADEDFTHQADEEIEINAVEIRLPRGVEVRVDGADPTNNVLLYDKGGLARTGNWGAAARRSYVILGARGTSRCIAVSPVRLREGSWNGSSCQPF